MGLPRIFSRKPPLNKKILFISSTTASVDNEDTFDYFASITSQLAFAIQTNYPDTELVIKVPESGGSRASAQQAQFIEAAVRSQNPFECIIVSPVNVHDLYLRLKPWIEDFGPNKIIFIDQGFTSDAYPHFHDDDIARPPYVQADWKDGGGIAARSMLKYFEKNEITCPNIVLIEGAIGSPERIEGFRLVMNESSNDHIEISYHQCLGNYSKKTARESFEGYLNNCLNNRRRIDGVFATNDEMALGIRDALVKEKERYVSIFGAEANFQLPIVIGFDGIRDLTFHIDNNDDFVYDTVNVRLKEQIKSLSVILDKSIMRKAGISEAEKFVEMKCISYRTVKRMSI